MKGTWQTDDRAPGGAGILLLAGVVILAASGAAAAVATAVVVLLIAAAVAVVLVVAALAAFLVYRARHPASLPRGIVPAPSVHELPGPERPAIGPQVVEHHHYIHTLPGEAAGEASWVPLVRGTVEHKED
jgi:hypothetical protein